MGNKTSPKTYNYLRDTTKQLIYKLLDPLIRLFLKIGLTPNMITTFGFVLNVGVAIWFVLAAEEKQRLDLSKVGWGGAMILFAGLFDMIDGQMARHAKLTTRYGALYDSVLDRYSELVMFLGICYYLVAYHYFLSSLFAFIAMIGSMMVSYIRARAEGLGIECRDGLMQRPERIVLIGLSGIACGIGAMWLGHDYRISVEGLPFHVFETMSIFTFPLAILAIMANYTAIMRLLHCKRVLQNGN